MDMIQLWKWTLGGGFDIFASKSGLFGFDIYLPLNFFWFWIFWLYFQSPLLKLKTKIHMPNISTSRNQSTSKCKTNDHPHSPRSCGGKIKSIWKSIHNHTTFVIRSVMKEYKCHWPPWLPRIFSTIFIREVICSCRDILRDMARTDSSLIL